MNSFSNIFKNLSHRVAVKVAAKARRRVVIAGRAAAEETRLDLEALEPRILYSGAPAVVPAPAPPVSEPAPAAQEAPAAVAEAPAETVVAAEAGTSEGVIPVVAVAEAAPLESATEPTAAASPEGAVAAAAVPVAGAEDAPVIAASETDVTLTQESLQSIADAAAERWDESGISAEQEAALAVVTYQIADLGGNKLGVAEGSTITIDHDAAGTGSWFIDQTPDQDEEFAADESGALSATAGAATSSYDLLSVLVHEQGHVLGLDDLAGDGDDVMNGVLGQDARRLPDSGHAEGVIPGSIEGPANLVAPPNLHDLPPFEPASPEGNSIYETNLSWLIPTPNVVRDLNIDVHAGQTVTIIVKSGDGLQTAIELLDSSSASIASATAGAGGETVIVQTAPVTADGIHKIKVSGASGTTGDFDIRVILNAAVEEETVKSSGNDSVAEAQDIDGAFRSAGVPGTDTAAVLGNAGTATGRLLASDNYNNLFHFELATGTSTVIATDIGDGESYEALAYNPVTGIMYASGGEEGAYLFAVDPETGAETELVRISENDTKAMAWSPDGSTLYSVNEYGNFGTIDIDSGDFTEIGAFDDPDWNEVEGIAFQPGTGLLYVSESEGDLFSLDLTNGTSTEVGEPGVELRSLEFLPDGTLLGGGDDDDDGSIFSLDPVTAQATLFGNTPTDEDTNSLEYLAPATPSDEEDEEDEDFYQFTADAGDLISLSLEGFSDGNLEILNSAGTVVATGAADPALSGLDVAGFHATETGTYYARVAKDGGKGAYSLLVIRNATLDTGANDSVAEAQDIDGAFRSAGVPGTDTAAVLGNAGTATSRLLASDNYNNLFHFELATGTSTVIATDIGDGESYEALAYNPVTGIMYASGGEEGAYLFAVDPETGAETELVRISENDTKAMAWSPDGSTLYSVNEYGNFGTIDIDSGDFTEIGAFDDPDWNEVEGIAFQPGTGLLYVSESEGDLFSLDLTNGTSTEVGEPGVELRSLEFLPDGTLLGGGDDDDDGSIFSLDPVTAQATLFGNTPTDEDTNSLEYLAPATPSDEDFYQFTLEAGDAVTLAATGPGAEELELLDSSGSVLATGTAGGPHGDLTIADFEVAADGTYFAWVANSGDIANYWLQVSRPGNELVPPTLTSFADAVVSGLENTETEISFADLAAKGDEADPDGIVEAFVVKTVSSGTLRIGADAGAATAFAAGSNDTIDASTFAFWTPDTDVVGPELGAFAVTAKDDSGKESFGAVEVAVDVFRSNSAEVVAGGTLTIGGDGDTEQLGLNVVGGDLVISSADDSISGGAGTTTNGNGDVIVPLSSLSAIGLNLGEGGDTLYIGDLTGFMGSLDIDGGAGQDEVSFGADVTLADGNSAAITSEEVAFRPGSNLTVGTTPANTGGIIIDATNSDGGTGRFTGIDVFAANLSATGSGEVSLTAEGGDGTFSSGIALRTGATVTTGTGAITVAGTVQDGAGSYSSGVSISGSTIAQTVDGGSANGAINIDGNGSGTGVYNMGVSFDHTSTITALGAGSIDINGTGSAASGTGYGHGVLINRGTKITSVDGAISVDGQGSAGGAQNAGVTLGVGSEVSASGAGAVSLTGTGGGGSTFNHGVSIGNGGGTVTSGSGAVSIEGTAGEGSGYGGGLVVAKGIIGHTDTGASSYGDVTLAGTGNAKATGAGYYNTGVSLDHGSSVTALGDADIDIDGQGGAGTGSGYSAGVSIHRATPVTTVDGNIAIDGTGGNGGSQNAGVVVQAGSEVTSSGDGIITLEGTGGTGTTFNHGVAVTNGGGTITSGSGAIAVEGTALAGTGYGSGVYLSKTTLGHTGAGGGDITINGEAHASSTGYYNTGVTIDHGSKVEAKGAAKLTVESTGGGGSGYSGGTRVAGGSTLSTEGADITLTSSARSSGPNSAGLVLYGATVSSGAGLTVEATGSANGTGNSNSGVSSTNSDISAAGTIDIDATGGSGISYNGGIRMSGGSLTGTLLDLDGDGSAETTSGTSNVGAYLSGVNLIGVDGGTIDGTGGLGTGYNHGAFLQGTSAGGIETVTGSTSDGNATSQETAGNLLPLPAGTFLPAALLMAGADRKARRGKGDVTLDADSAEAGGQKIVGQAGKNLVGRCADALDGLFHSILGSRWAGRDGDGGVIGSPANRGGGDALTRQTRWGAGLLG